VSRDHVKELGNQRPDKPFFFFKPKASLTIQRGPKPDGNEEAKPKLLIPKGVNVHYEVELALHINRHVHHLAYQKAKAADEAAWEQLWKSCIGGYGIGTAPLSLFRRLV
jgi:2-keto-4-pentenoate hydratase/2-oxohepta-3-ene-1,7-dioic acid hydratase in catechol pathway